MTQVIHDIVSPKSRDYAKTDLSEPRNNELNIIRSRLRPKLSIGSSCADIFSVGLILSLNEPQHGYKMFNVLDEVAHLKNKVFKTSRFSPLGSTLTLFF